MAEVFVEEEGDLVEGFAGFGGLVVHAELGVGLAFVDLELGVDAGLAELAVDADGVAEQEVAGAGGEDGRREAVHVAVDGGEQGVGEVVAVRVDLGSGVAEAVARDEDVVDELVGVEGVAGLGDVGHGSASGDGGGHGQAFLFGAEHHFERERAAGGGAEDGDVFGCGGFKDGFVDGHGVVERGGEVGDGRHAVVDGEDFEVAEAGHEDCLRGAGLAGEEDVATAVDVDEDLVLVLGGKGVGGDVEDGDAGDGFGLDRDVHAGAQGGEGLNGFGGLLVGGDAPLGAGGPEMIPVGIERGADELLHLGADVGRDGEALGGNLSRRGGLGRGLGGRGENGGCRAEDGLEGKARFSAGSHCWSVMRMVGAAREESTGRKMGRRSAAPSVLSLQVVELGEEVVEGDADRGVGDGQGAVGRLLESFGGGDIDAALHGVDDPDDVSSHLQVVVHADLQVAEGVCGGEDFDAGEGRCADDGLNRVGAAQDADVRDAEACGGDLEALFGAGDDMPGAAIGVDDAGDGCLHHGVRPFAHVSLPQFAVDVIAVGAVGRREVLRDGGQDRACHANSIARAGERRKQFRCRRGGLKISTLGDRRLVLVEFGP